MKRYLINGALMLITGFLLSGCHDKLEGDYSTPALDQKKKEFDEAFKQAFTSNIDPNQDWGFGPVSYAGTRSAEVNSNQWGTGIYADFPKPDNITSDERSAVLAVFNQVGNESYTALVNWDKFFVQQVYCGSENGSKMNRLACGGDEIVNNFNAGKFSGNPNQGCMLMFDASTSDWSYETSQGGSERFHYFRMEKINGNYYVGFDHASKRQAAANANEQYDRDLIYNDWIVKIVPGKSVNTTNDGNNNANVPEGGSTDDSTTEVTVDDDTYPANTITTKTEYFKKRTLVDYGRVFCEDLGGSYRSNLKDFDYNDVVFDAYLWKEQEWKKVSTIHTYEVQVYDITSSKSHKWFEKTQEEYDADYQAALDATKAAAQAAAQAAGTEYIEPTEPSDTVSHWKWDEYDLIDTTYNAAKSYKRYEVVEGPTEEIITDRAPKFYADICLLAAGGTKPLKVGGNDALEVHQAFGGFSVDCIINTYDEHTGDGSYYHEVAEQVILDRMEVTSDINAEEPLIRDIPIYVHLIGGLGAAATKIVAEQGQVPQKFMTRNKDKWTSERFFLGDAYPNFTNWAQGVTASFSKGAQNASLYNGYPSAEAGLSFSVIVGDPSTSDLPVTQIDTPKETITDGSFIEIVYNELDGTQTTIPPSGAGTPSSPSNSQTSEGSGSGSGSTTEETTTPPTGNTGSASWSSTSYNGSNGGQELISSTALSDAGFVSTKGVTITIIGNCWDWGGPGWQVNVKDGNYNSIFQTSNSNSNGANVTYNDNKATVVISLSSTDFGRVLSSAGLHIECNFTNANSMNISITQ